MNARDADVLFTEQLMESISALIGGDQRRALDLLQATCPTGRELFAGCSGFANIIAYAGARASHPDATGPLIVEVDAVAGADPLTLDAVHDVGAFTAAVGNQDMEGAWLIFCQAGGKGDHHQGAFVAELMAMTATVVKAQQPGGDPLMGATEAPQPDPGDETPAMASAEELRRRESAEQARRDHEHNERELNNRGWQNYLYADPEGWE